MDGKENIAAILALARRKLNEGKPSFALQAVSVGFHVASQSCLLITLSECEIPTEMHHKRVI